MATEIKPNFPSDGQRVDPEGTEGLILKEAAVDHAVTFVWQQRHSPREVLGMLDEYLVLLGSTRSQDQSYLIEGHGFTQTLARFATEVSGHQRFTLINGAIEMFSKHNPQRDNRAIVLAFFASDLKIRGLVTEGESLAVRLQRSERKHLREELVLKDLIEETLRD